MRFRQSLVVVFTASSLLILAGCRTPGAPVPSRSVKSGTKLVSAKPDLIPAWTDKTAAKVALTGFVERSVTRGEAGYIPENDRVAVVSAGVLTAIPDLAPLRQLIEYLSDSHYRVYLVGDADVAALRSTAQGKLGLGAAEILGAYPEADYVVRDGRPVIVPRAGSARVAKPVVIDRALGRRPVLAIGVEAGDVAMLEYTTLANPLPAAAFVLTAGAGGEAAKLRAEAKTRGWTSVDPGADWAGGKR